MKKRKFFIETYGCQMNFSDSEIVASVLTEEGYGSTPDISEADLILINTCSIRDNAEQRVLRRLKALHPLKKKRPEVIIGLLGCMAERMKEELLEREKILDLIAGPDVYRDLPRLIHQVWDGQKAVNIDLSDDETYSDIQPVRYDSNGISAFISIMRGCENFCAYCVVPYVRGVERSRDVESLIQEVRTLYLQGYREVTLLGQNVNSYCWIDNNNSKTLFADLLRQVAEIHPDLRIRFLTSHPKDLSEEILNVMASHQNICRSIHLPVQSGSTTVLQRMNRSYTREQYLERIHSIRRILPDCSITTDLIAGFCGETEEEHQETLSLMKEVEFDGSFMFHYSERPNTLAALKLADDIAPEIKERRLKEIINLQQSLSFSRNEKDKGKTFEVLIEGYSKRSDMFFSGRNSQNKVVVFPKTENSPGDYVRVKIDGFTSATLLGKPVL